MNTQQIAHAKQVLGLLGRTRKQIPFFYTSAGPQGIPVLLVDAEELDDTAILNLISASLRKGFARGVIARDVEDGRLVFTTDARGGLQLSAGLVGTLDEMIPGLRFARVAVTGSR